MSQSPCPSSSDLPRGPPVGTGRCLLEIRVQAGTAGSGHTRGVGGKRARLARTLTQHGALQECKLGFVLDRL